MAQPMPGLMLGWVVQGRIPRSIPVCPRLSLAVALGVCPLADRGSVGSSCALTFLGAD